MADLNVKVDLNSVGKLIKENEEFIFSYKPERNIEIGWWVCNHKIKAYRMNVKLPKGSIEKLIGKKLTWEDEPVELKEKLIETNQRGV